MIILPDPPLLGAPEKFESWYPGQSEALLHALSSEKRFIVLCIPTGGGKTLVNILYGLLTGRMIYLTSTKGLMEQLNRDFTEIGLADIRGQNNYRCKAVEPDGELYRRYKDLQYQIPRPGGGVGCGDGPCHFGVTCDRVWSGCDYFDKYREATKAQLVVSNYAKWLSDSPVMGAAGGQLGDLKDLGKFDTMILDEAHEIIEILTGIMRIELTKDEIEECGQIWEPYDDFAEWHGWAYEAKTSVKKALEASNGRDIASSKRLRALDRKIQKILMARDRWIAEVHGKTVTLDPVWPASFAEQILFRGTPKIILSSATVREKTAQLLGIPDDDVDFLELDSQFPKESRPVIHLSTVKFDKKTKPADRLNWVRKMDQIIDGRRDRKGIIHTVSYQNRNFIMANSRHKDIMITHGKPDTIRTVERFKKMKGPVVLVSPSVSTGWDFPYEECEFQIIAKVPFRDGRPLIERERARIDKKLVFYNVMQELVQMSGRGMRAKDDRCETFIIDDNLVWFWNKYKQFAPGWFRKSLKKNRTEIPEPLEKL